MPWPPGTSSSCRAAVGVGVVAALSKCAVILQGGALSEQFRVLSLGQLLVGKLSASGACRVGLALSLACLAKGCTAVVGWCSITARISEQWQADQGL